MRHQRSSKPFSPSPHEAEAEGAEGGGDSEYVKREVLVSVSITLGSSEEKNRTDVTLSFGGVFRRERLEEILAAAREELERRVEVMEA